MKPMKKHFKYYSTGNVFLVGLGALYGINVALAIFGRIFPAFLASDAFSWVSIVCNQIAFVGATYFYSRSKQVDFVPAVKLNTKLSGKQVGLIAAISVACIMAFLPVAYLFIFLITKIGFSPDVSFPDTTGWKGYILSVIFMAALPALGEEIFMRGAVLGSAERKRNFVKAILITAGLFSIMHGNALQTVHQFLLGVVLAYVVTVTRSLWAGVLLHFFNNFISVTADSVSALISEKSESVAQAAANPLVEVLVGLAFFVGGSILLIALLVKFTEVTKDRRTSNAQIIDVYPNGPLGEAKYRFGGAFAIFKSLFKKGGLKVGIRYLNSFLNNLIPPFEEEMPSREELYPAHIKLAFAVVGAIWLVNLFVYSL